MVVPNLAMQIRVKIVRFDEVLVLIHAVSIS